MIELELYRVRKSMVEVKVDEVSYDPIIMAFVVAPIIAPIVGLVAVGAIANLFPITLGK